MFWNVLFYHIHLLYVICAGVKWGRPLCINMQFLSDSVPETLFSSSSPSFSLLPWQHCSLLLKHQRKLHQALFCVFLNCPFTYQSNYCRLLKILKEASVFINIQTKSLYHKTNKVWNRCFFGKLHGRFTIFTDFWRIKAFQICIISEP